MRLPLHRKLFITVGVGTAALALVMSLLVDLTVARQVSKQEDRGLKQTQAAFDALENYRRAQLLERCRLVSDLPYFKAAVAVYDPTLAADEQNEALATVSDVARRILQRVDVDMLVLTGTNGSPLLGVGPALETGVHDLTPLGAIARQAVTRNFAEGTLSLGDGLLSVIAVPVEVGGLQLGALCLGTALDSRLAASLENMSGSAVALIGERGVIARSQGLGPEIESALYDTWTRLPHEQGPGERLSMVKLEGQRYRTLWLPLQGPQGRMLGSIVVLRSESQALAFVANVRRGLTGIALTAVLVGLFFSYMFARQITIPVLKLVAFTKRVARGELQGNLFLGTGDELSELGDAFNKMTTGLAESRKSLEESHRALELRTVEVESANEELIRSKHELESANAALQQAHAELIQAGKMAAFGELGAGLAHELRQPLSAIRGFAQLVQRKLPQDAEDSQRYLGLVVSSVDHMTKTVQGLKDFARKSDFEFREVQVNQVLEQTGLLLGTQLSQRGIQFKLDLDPGANIMLANANQLQQVFTNLLANARDAAPESNGQIVVQTRSVGDGGYVMVSVSDNGSGIAPDVLPKIFNSFFTTKAEGAGTGLGLSITQGIIHDHGGRIDVTSSPGQGTTFRLFLPTREAKNCWEMIDCASDCRPEISGKEDCAIYREKRGHRCWESLKELGRHDPNVAQPDCEMCPVFMAKTAFLLPPEEFPKAA